MSDVMNAGVVLSLVAGTVAGTLGLLDWRQFRGAPFGRLVFIIPVVHAGFVGFHVFPLVSGQGTARAQSAWRYPAFGGERLRDARVRRTRRLHAAGRPPPREDESAVRREPMILEYVNVALSALSGVALAYLLLSGKYVIAYTRFFRRVLVRVPAVRDHRPRRARAPGSGAPPRPRGECLLRGVRLLLAHRGPAAGTGRLPGARGTLEEVPLGGELEEEEARERRGSEHRDEGDTGVQ